MRTGKVSPVANSSLRKLEHRENRDIITGKRRKVILIQEGWKIVRTEKFTLVANYCPGRI